MLRVSEVLASVHGFVAKSFFDSEDLVVLGKSIRSAGSSTLNFTGAKAANQVCDEVIFGFARSVGHHDSPASLLRHVAGFNTLGDGSDLVDLEKKRVTHFLVNSGLNSGGVGDEEVVADNLDLVAELLGHFNVSLEVVLVEGVFNRNHGVLVNQLFVEVDGLVHCQDSIVLSSFLAEVVGFGFGVVEFRGSDVQSDVNFTFVA